MWRPHESHDHDGREATLWNLRSRLHFGHSACSPSAANRERHRCSKQAASSGNSRANSMSEYCDSDALDRFGSLRLTLDIGGSLHISYLLSRDNRPNFYELRDNLRNGPPGRCLLYTSPSPRDG